MAVEIIVEDGSIVPNANSYVSVEDVKKYCSDRGLLLPDTDDKIASNIIIAMDYIELLANRFIGVQQTEEQSLSWPRSPKCIYDKLPVENQIPDNLKKGLCQLTHDSYTVNGELIKNETGYAIKQEVIGPLSTTYAVDASGNQTDIQPQYVKFNRTISSLLKSINTNRVYR